MIANPLTVENNGVMMSRSELIWGVVLYGIIMYAAGFITSAMMVV